MDQEQHKNHARLADGVSILVGLWLIASPFVMGFSAMTGEMWNNVIFGALIALLGLVRLYMPEQAEWMSWLNAVFGLWLILSPFVLSYPTVVDLWDNIIAGLIVVIAGSRSAMETRMLSTTSRAGMA